MYNARYCCLILTKFEFSQQILTEVLYLKFHENPSSVSRVVPCRQTDGEKGVMK